MINHPISSNNHPSARYTLKKWALLSTVATSDFFPYCILKLHSHQTADQPPTNADQFLWLGMVGSSKKLPALIEERIYPRSTPAVSAQYSRCTYAQIPLFPTYPSSSG